MSRLKQRGDTLVEVMLATAVLSLVLAGAFTLANRATRLSQTANERTQVSNLMQRQAELIRAAYDKPDSGFLNSIKPLSKENQNFCDLDKGSNPQDNSFYMAEENNKVVLKELKIDNGKIKDANPNDLFDIWVEPVAKDQVIDFYVYACWEGIGGEARQNSGLVVRLAK